MIHGRVPPGHSSFAAAASVLRGSHREAAMAITRRKLIGAMARLGGAGAAYETLAAWNFLKPPDARAASLALPQDSGAGRTVAILGAGVAGLCAAFELERAGYDCVDRKSTRLNSSHLGI